MPISTSKSKQNLLVENIKTLVYAGLIAVAIRTVAFEPFNIPSGSMIPTLLIGDYLFVSKYSYGYSRFSLPFSPPLFSGRIFESLPRRGDVAVFKYPRDNATDYIKRIVGLPGDRVQMRQGQLYINGQPCPRTSLGLYETRDTGVRVALNRYTETLPGPDGRPGMKYEILKTTDGVENARRPGFDPTREQDPNNTPEFTVPAGHVFAMGDNRDNSADSRFMNGVGFVPIENLVGRAEFLFFSIDAEHPWWQFWAWPFDIRWSRLLMPVR